MALGSQLDAHSILGERARALVPLADEWADYGDTEGRIADPVVARFHDDGLYAMWVPKVLGGSELDPVQSLEVLENVSYGDASTGWVLMASCLSIGTGARILSDAATAEMWADGKRPVIAGQGTRPGTATPTEGGYLLSGAWSFASGIKHGTHIHTLGIIETTGEPRIFVLPVEQATLIDNWDVIGLRGTGSIDYTIDAVFVPEGYTHFATIAHSEHGGAVQHRHHRVRPDRPLRLGARRRPPAARRARDVDEGEGGTGGRSPTASASTRASHRPRDVPSVRTFVYETWSDVLETLDKGEQPSVRQHTLIRLALTNVTQALHDVANFVYLAAGSTSSLGAARSSACCATCAGTQHVTSPPVVQTVGRELLGLAQGMRWQFLDLVPGNRLAGDALRQDVAGRARVSRPRRDRRRPRP